MPSDPMFTAILGPNPSAASIELLSALQAIAPPTSNTGAAIYSLGMPSKLVAGSGDDSIYTGDSSDGIYAGAGNNSIYSGAGNNLILALGGDDTVFSGAGSDIISVGAGNNNVYANDGNNVVIVGAGNDLIYAGHGNDYIQAGHGNNSIYAWDGNNTVIAGAGNDLITSEEGNDVIVAGDGNNTVRAGSGKNIISSGDGNDFVQVGAGDDVITTGDGSNTVYAGEGDNRVSTGDGNDSVYAGNGNDVIYTGAGNDFIYTGDGNNLVNAGTGNDTVRLGNGKDQIVLEAGEGSVTIANFNASVDKLRLGESLLGTSISFVAQGNDTLVKANGELLATIQNAQVTRASLAANGSLAFRYEVVDLGTLAAYPNTSSVAATAINDYRQIAGKSGVNVIPVTVPVTPATAPVGQGFTWENGVMTGLTPTGLKVGGPNDGQQFTLNGRGSTIAGMNDLGTTVGASDETFPAGATDRAVIWTRNVDGSYGLVVNQFAGLTNGNLPSTAVAATPTTPAIPSTYMPGDWSIESYFFSANNSGTVAGRNIYGPGTPAGSGNRSKPVVFEQGHAMDLPTLVGDTGTAQGINAAGDLVGVIDGDGVLNNTTVSTAAVWTRGNDGQYTLMDLGRFGATQSSAREINDFGEVVGTVTTGSGSTAITEGFVYQDGAVQFLGGLGGTSSAVNNINNFGQVVGQSRNAAGQNRAVLWADGAVIDLNNAISAGVPALNGAAVTLSNATGINSFGDIIAQGNYSFTGPGATTPSTGTRSYLLRAVLA
jgi:probable HAF family extracellular repeat protein